MDLVLSLGGNNRSNNKGLFTFRLQDNFGGTVDHVVRSKSTPGPELETDGVETTVSFVNRTDRKDKNE
jgi:hypothetical protein